MEFRARPKGDYLMNAEWQDLHTLTEHWQSEMHFYEDEMRFLMVLFEKYFTALVEKENIESTKNVAASMTAVDLTRSSLAQRIQQHLQNILDLVERRSEKNTGDFRFDHQLLEDDFVSFAERFRSLKRDVFRLAENIAKTEKLHLISG